MEDSTTQFPKPNEFVLFEKEAYAMTHIQTWAAAEFLMTKLEPIKLKDLNRNDRVCAICQEEFFVSQDVRLSHAPVKTVCGHVFGRKCIIRWLDPFGNWRLSEDDAWDPESDARLHGNRNCPMCRQIFFSDFPVEPQPMEELAHRLSFWDVAYASAGVARSEKEERSRKYLWQYVDYCRSMNDRNLGRQQIFGLQQMAQAVLLCFAKSLRNQNLTPEQEILRKRLERIGRKDLKKCLFENRSFVFNIDRDDNERIEFEGRPLPR